MTFTTKFYILWALATFALLCKLGSAQDGGSIVYTNRAEYNVGIEYDVESSVISAGVSNALWDSSSADMGEWLDDNEMTLSEFSTNAWNYVPDWVPDSLADTDVTPYSSDFSLGDATGLQSAREALSSGVEAFADSNPSDVAGTRVVSYDALDASSTSFGENGESSVGMESSFTRAITESELLPLVADLPNDDGISGFFTSGVPRVLSGLASAINSFRSTQSWFRVFVHSLCSAYLLFQLSLMLRAVGRQFWDAMVLAITGQDFQRYDKEV